MLILADQVADLPPVDLPVDLNGNFRFLLFELILLDQVADLPPPIEHRSLEHHYTKSVELAHIGRSSGRSTPPPIKHRSLEHNYTESVELAHIGRASGKSTPQPIQHRSLEHHYTKSGRSTPTLHLSVHLNGNFTFLLSECCCKG